MSQVISTTSLVQIIRDITDPDDTHWAGPTLASHRLGAAVAAEGEVAVGFDDAGDDQEVDHHRDHAPEPQGHLVRDISCY